MGGAPILENGPLFHLSAGRRAHLWFLPFFEAQSLLVLLFSLPMLVLVAKPPCVDQRLRDRRRARLGGLGRRGVDRRSAARALSAPIRPRPDECAASACGAIPVIRTISSNGHWWANVLMGIGAPYGWVTLVGPVAMWLFLDKLTGIPATESQRVEEPRRGVPCLPALDERVRAVVPQASSPSKLDGAPLRTSTAAGEPAPRTNTRRPAMSDIRPFRFEIPDGALRGLKRRLGETRWPDRETREDWSQGVPLAYAQEVCAYWRDEIRLAALRGEAERASPQFMTTIDGLDIHFIHVRSPHAKRCRCSHPRLAGFGDRVPEGDRAAHRSGRARRRRRRRVPRRLPVAAGLRILRQAEATGWGIERIADAWAQLMERLGYDALCRAGRRLGLGGDDARSACGRRGTARRST